MNNIKYQCYILLLLLPTLLCANNYKERVLLISSYNSAFPTVFQQIDGIRSQLPNVELDIEFMDTKRFINDTTLLELFTESIDYKIKSKKTFDAVLLADDAAFEFALTHQHTLFKEMPLVFLGVNNKNKGLEQDNNPYMTGIIESVSLKETIETMIQLFPENQEIIIITDNTRTAYANFSQIETIKSDFPSITFSSIDLHLINFETFKEKLNEIPNNTPVLLLSAYQDSEEVTVTFEELLTLLNAHCKAPIFHLWEHGIGEGLLGGKVISHYTQGQKAAQIVREILNGRTIQSFKVINAKTNSYCFDKEKLDQFNIKRAHLPATTIIINQKHEFFRQYHKEIKLTLALFIIMLTMIIVLFINIRKKRKIQHSLSKQNKAVKKINNDYIAQNIALQEATRKAEKTEQRYKHMFDNNPISVWEEDTSDFIKYIRSQSANMTKEELESHIANHPEFLKNCMSKIKIRSVNNATLNLFGFSDKNDLIQHFEDTLTPNSLVTFKDIIISMASGANSFTAKTEYKTKHGRILTALLYIHTFEEEKMSIISIVDTSELNAVQTELKEKIKELEDVKERLETINTELRDAKEKAEETDRLKSAFLANISHEIRTPMNGILGFSKLLQNNEVEQEKKEKYIKVINKSGRRMLNTLNDIIDISKIQAGEVKLNLKKINLASELNMIKKSFEQEAQNKGLDFRFESFIKADLVITSDRNKLISIINKLIRNALKFTNEGFVKTTVKIEDNQLYIEVEDSGIGIPKNRQKAVFERFMQSDIEDTEVREGSGLGLSITKYYVEMLDGKIELSSNPGEGTIVNVYLPWENRKLPLENSMPEKHNKQAKILLAEDDDISFLQLEILLENYEIKRAKNGKEAIELFKQETFDLILMDLKMPISSGYNAIAYIRKNNAQIPIIAQSAYTLEREKNKAYEMGCNDYITKPISRDQLNAVITKYI